MIWRSNRPHKYNAVKTIVDDIKFDSRAEADYYCLIRLDKTIKILELQPKTYLTEARILYKPDFLLEKNGIEYYVDVKGVETPVFKIKKRLWKFYGDKRLVIISRKGKAFIQSEILEPQAIR